MNPDHFDPRPAWLYDALDADAPAAADARLRQRVLRTIAAEATPSHRTVQPVDAAAPWQPWGPGLQIKVLHEADGVMSYLVRLAAGASLPPHRHPIDEECVVLEGTVNIGSLRVPAGGYHRGLRGLPHDALRSDEGAVIFLRGAVPDTAQVL
jgi:anti-sigma factor ChrR (cupin superfamily)